MDDVWVGEIYNTPLDSIEGDLSQQFVILYRDTMNYVICRNHG